MKIYKQLTKLALFLHTFSYKLVTQFVIKSESLHPKHRLMNYHKFFVDNLCGWDKVLDIGCGNGALTYDVAKKAKFISGIDLSKENINKAEKQYSANNINYFQGDATKHNFKQKFDAIILSNVLEHIEHRTDFLKRIKTLAPKILIRVPMIDRDWITLYKKELDLEWRLDPTHFTEYTVESFKEEMKAVDLKVQNYSIQFGEIWAVVIKNEKKHLKNKDKKQKNI